MNEQNAEVVVRLFGIICIFLGLTGIAYITVSHIIPFLGAPRWLMENIWVVVSQSMISSPIWIAGGLVLIWMSSRIASLIYKSRAGA
jgi:uncharacterized membrane protein SirB2